MLRIKYVFFIYFVYHNQTWYKNNYFVLYTIVKHNSVFVFFFFISCFHYLHLLYPRTLYVLLIFSHICSRLILCLWTRKLHCSILLQPQPIHLVYVSVITFYAHMIMDLKLVNYNATFTVKFFIISLF